MARPKSIGPTPGEVEILQVLWQDGACTVRDVHTKLVKKRPVAHTTVASMMQLMDEKGQLKLVDRKRPFKYEPALTPDAARDALLNDIRDRVFKGSARDLILHLVAGKKLSQPQLLQLSKLLSAVL